MLTRRGGGVDTDGLSGGAGSHVNKERSVAHFVDIIFTHTVLKKQTLSQITQTIFPIKFLMFCQALRHQSCPQSAKKPNYLVLRQGWGWGGSI